MTTKKIVIMATGPFSERSVRPTGTLKVEAEDADSKRKMISKSAGTISPIQSASEMLTDLLQTSDPLRSALVIRLARMIVDALRNATTANLQEAVAAPTDVGSMAYLLSMAASSDKAVRELDPTAEAIVRGAVMKQELLKRAGGVLETARVAELLGITRQAVLKRVRSGKLLAIQDPSGGLQFPACQFTSTGTIDGFEKVLAAFNVDSPWARLAVLLDTDEGVGGRMFIDALRAGELEGVLGVVRSFGV